MTSESAVEGLETDQARLRWLIAVALSLVAVGGLGRIVTDLEGAATLGRIGVVGFALLAVAGQVWRVRILFAAALALSLALIVLGGGPSDAVLATVTRGLDTAAFMAAFLILLGVLREAAETSPAVRDSGALMTRQPPGRRYLALHVGSHLLGTLLSFGVLSLLGPMVQRGVAAAARAEPGAAGIAAVRERRQLSALLRGFSWMILWSPTTITQALLFSLIPGIQAGPLAALGGLLAFLVLVLGWAEDRIAWRGMRGRSGRAAVRPDGTAGVLARMGLVCALVVAVVVAIQGLFGLATVPALMLGVPCFSLAWILVQGLGQGLGGAARATAGRVGQIVGRGFVAASPEVLTLACAAYIGTLAADLVPGEAVSAAVLWAGLSPLLFLAGVTTVIVALAQVALSPLMSLVFLGTALAETQVPGVSPTALGLALAAGWALSLTGSPYTAAALILGRVTGIDGRRITWHWNGAFTLLAFGAVVLCLFLATRVS